MCARHGVRCQEYRVTKPSGKIHSSKNNKDKCTIVAVTSTVEEEIVVTWACVRGLDLKSFPGEGVAGLNQEVVGEGDGRLTQTERTVCTGPYSISRRERECVFRGVKVAGVT